MNGELSGARRDDAGRSRDRTDPPTAVSWNDSRAWRCKIIGDDLEAFHGESKSKTDRLHHRLLSRPEHEKSSEESSFAATPDPIPFNRGKRKFGDTMQIIERTDALAIDPDCPVSAHADQKEAGRSGKS